MSTATVERVVTFDPIKHEYRVDGVVRPGPSAVLKAVGLSDDTYYTPGSAERGRERHEAIFLVQRGLVSVNDVAEEVRPYVRGWQDFCGATGFKVATQEAFRAHASGAYCGTPDITGTMKVEGRGRSGVLDVKTGQYERWHGVQLAAYRDLVGLRYGWILLLKPDGYKLKTGGLGFDGITRPFDDPYWARVWNAALVMYQCTKEAA